VGEELYQYTLMSPLNIFVAQPQSVTCASFPWILLATAKVFNSECFHLQLTTPDFHRFALLLLLSTSLGQ
jgi:hypothetical protein